MYLCTGNLILISVYGLPWHMLASKMRCGLHSPHSQQEPECRDADDPERHQERLGAARQKALPAHAEPGSSAQRHQPQHEALLLR